MAARRKRVSQGGKKRKERQGRTKLATTSVGVLLQQLDDHRVELHETGVLTKVVLGLAEEAVKTAIVASDGNLARLL
jgi:hypothetical protein